MLGPVATAFQSELIDAPPGRPRVTRQPFTAAVPAVTVTEATKPPFHWSCTEYAAEQADGGGVVGVPPSRVRFFCRTCHCVPHRSQFAPTKLPPAVVSPLSRHLR